MDHLPKPRKSSYRLLEVPIFAPNIDYDHGPLFGYLKRIGWKIEDIIDIEHTKRSRNEIHCVLQRWTYFGLIYEVTGNILSIEEWSTTSRDKRVLTTQPLLKLLNDWIDVATIKTLSQRREQVEHLSECLTMMADIYDTIYVRDTTFLEQDFHISVQILYECVVRAVTIAVSPANENPTAIPPVKYRDLLGPVKILGQRMKHLGWCLSEVHMLSEFCSVTEMMFASSLDRPGPDKTHSGCNRMKCFAYQVTKEYTTKHATSGCSCEYVYASQNTLSELLPATDRCIPLIGPSQPQRGDDGFLYVDLMGSRGPNNSLKYVAISHVWSDGLGNNTANAIPICQFNRIRCLTGDLCNGEPSAFWLDTLCFPLQPQAAYDIALIRMRQSYEDADKVLVLDHYLLQHDCLDMPIEEVAMRITCAPWNRRLWTLQEGMLAQKLFFQFRDTFSDLGGWCNRDQAHPTSLQALMFSQTWRAYSSLRVLETAESKKMNILQSNKALTFRSTSVSDDEPLCLGNLLGVDPEKVVRAGSKSERMRVIWESLTEQFTSTIFWNAPKLPYEGLQWAAATLMEGGCGRARSSSPSAQLEFGHGLVVHTPGIAFTMSALEPLVPRSFRLVLEDNVRFIVQWDDLWASKATPREKAKTLTPKDDTTAEFAILLGKPISIEVDDGSDVAFFALACKITQYPKLYRRVQILGRVRMYRVEYLKYHPDALLAPSPHRHENSNNDLSLAPTEADLAARLTMGLSRAEAIWQQQSGPDIARGTIIQEGIWCVM